MPRRERRQLNRSITAAARSYRTGSTKPGKTRDVRPGEEWQRAAWDFYDLIGEFRQAPTIQGALLSRAKLVPMEKNADGVWEKTTNAVVLEAMRQLFGDEDGQSEMLNQWGIHMTVAGEGFLISPVEADMEDADEWQVAAATECVSRGGKWRVNGKELEGDGRMVTQIWRPHPRNKKLADSPARAALPILSLLLALTKRTAAQIDSRLTGNGIVLLPSETEFPAGPTRSYNTGDPIVPFDGIDANDPQGLADMLLENARIAIENPESAEAMIPIFGMAPGEHLKEAKHITFWSELDKAAPALREELITRLARTMDIPVEVLLGAQGSNHWNAWLSDENNVKIHAEPTLRLITAGLTRKYLRKAIEGEDGIDDVMRFKIVADTSDMRLRPNRSKEALELGDRLMLSDEAVLRENGFTEEDMMTEEGLKIALLRKMASGSTTPELVAYANRVLGLDVPEVTDNRPPAEARPTPTLVEHPTRDAPSEEAAKLNELAAAGLIMVNTALQRAGNRMKSKLALGATDSPANRLYMGIKVSPKDCGDLLQDAWECVYLDEYGVDPAALARVLDTYTRGLLANQTEPSRASLRSALTLLSGRKAA